MAQRFRADVYDCCCVTKTSACLNPLNTSVKERLSPSIKNTVTEHYELYSF